MIKITITKEEVRHMEGVGKTSGKPYSMNFQTAYAHTVDKDGVLNDFPEKFEFILDKDQKPYVRGDYSLQPPSIYVGRNGNLELGAPILKSLEAKKAA